MQRTRNMLHRFASDETGASAVEYGLLLALMAVAILGSLTALGTATNNQFKTTAGKLT